MQEVVLQDPGVRPVIYLTLPGVTAHRGAGTGRQAASRGTRLLVPDADQWRGLRPGMAVAGRTLDAVGESRHPASQPAMVTRTPISRALSWAEATAGQHPAKVHDHLIINVLAGGRHEEFQLGSDLDGDLAVVTYGNRTDSFQQRHHGAPFDVVAGRMLKDLAESIPVAAVEVF
jgi:hypothetical protein